MSQIEIPHKINKMGRVSPMNNSTPLSKTREINSPNRSRIQMTEQNSHFVSKSQTSFDIQSKEEDQNETCSNHWFNEDRMEWNS